MNCSCIASLVVLSFAVAGCGEGSGSVASAPVPITSAASAAVLSRTSTIGAVLPPTPATTPGTYPALAAANLADPANPSALSARNVAPGDLAITVGSDGKSYTLSFNKATIPYPTAGSVAYAVADPGFGRQVTETTRYSDGSTSTQVISDNGATVNRPTADSGAPTTTSRYFSTRASEARSELDRAVTLKPATLPVVMTPTR